MQWLNENGSAINAVTGIATLFVWLFYAQLLYANYVRQTRPKLIINRGSGKDIDSHCLISNMSSESIYLVSVIGVVGSQETMYVSDITDSVQEVSVTEEAGGDGATFQGPIGSGGCYLFSSYRNIISSVIRHDVRQQEGDPGRCEGVDYIEIRVVASYGSEDKPVGVHRTFRVGDSGVSLTPASFSTIRLTGRRGQRKTLAWLEEVEPQA